MEDIPWLPIAMVFIAFLSWLRNRVKEASEIRQARNSAKAEIARGRRTTEPAKKAYESPYREAPARELVEEEPKTFRELFNEINAQKESAPPPVPASRTNYQPPPLPNATPEPEIEEWGDGDGFGATTPPSLQASAKRAKTKPRIKKQKHSIAKILGDGDQLRNALILKEILSPPKALQNKGRR